MATPKPALAAWIVNERERMGWKLEELSRRLIDLGCQAAPNTVRLWEAPRGRPPKPSTIAVMERLFSSEAPTASPLADFDGLAAAILEMAQAVREQSAVMVSQQKSHDEWMEKLAAGLVGLLALAPAEASTSAPVPAER